jgi:hypothetical protein
VQLILAGSDLLFDLLHFLVDLFEAVRCVDSLAGLLPVVEEDAVEGRGKLDPALNRLVDEDGVALEFTQFFVVGVD